MTPGSPKPDADDTASTGASEADAARPVDFEPDRGAGPGKGGKAEPPDAAELAGTKRKDGERDRPDKNAPGSQPVDRLTTESDDGAS